MLDHYEKTRKKRPPEEEPIRPPTHDLRGLLRAQALAEKKDVAALVALCQEGQDDSIEASRDGMRDLTRSSAAEALAGLGGAEVEAIKSALDKRPKATGWLIYALGRSGTPSALDVLQKLAEQEGGDEEYRTQNIAHALALNGEAGKKVLKRLAEQESEMGETAREWLQRKAKPTWPAPTWSRPKAGSLPKTVPDAR